MKLRNKRTGDIWEFDGGFSMKATQETAEKAGAESGSLTCFESSIAELNEEWEDYEENEYYYAITSIKADDGITKMKNKHNDMTAFDKAIGNYFETKEEAEKAVEKLKTWKRLKDNGFKFEGIKQDYTRLFYREIPMRNGRKYLQFNKSEDEDWINENWKDLKLLFGGEE